MRLPGRLPDRPVRRVLVSGEYPELAQSLEKLGVEAIRTEPDPRLAPGHAGMRAKWRTVCWKRESAAEPVGGPGHPLLGNPTTPRAGVSSGRSVQCFNRQPLGHGESENRGPSHLAGHKQAWLALAICAAGLCGLFLRPGGPFQRHHRGSRDRAGVGEYWC